MFWNKLKKHLPKTSLMAAGYDICSQTGSVTSDLYQACQTCVDRYNGSGVWTAFGCFNAGDQNGLIKDMLTFSIGTIGGVALPLILFGAFTVSTSASNPERLKLGQEVITAAVSGLIFVVFSVSLLEFVGVDVLKIPGL